MEAGTDTRFVATNKRDGAFDIYGHNTKRGEIENRIEDPKVAVKADRLSCHRFWAAQFRLLLHAAVVPSPGSSRASRIGFPGRSSARRREAPVKPGTPRRPSS